MSFPTTPAMVSKEDERKFNISIVDPSIKKETEGGYTVTRKRFTRRPRRTFSTGFTNIQEADKLALETLYNDLGGPSTIFNWTSPQTGEVVPVRFTADLQFNYVGLGGLHRWDVDITIQEA